MKAIEGEERNMTVTGSGGQDNEGEEEIEGRDVDPDAMAFIKAKKKVDDLHKAKKMEKKTGGAH